MRILGALAVIAGAYLLVAFRRAAKNAREMDEVDFVESYFDILAGLHMRLVAGLLLVCFGLILLLGTF